MTQFCLIFSVYNACSCLPLNFQPAAQRLLSKAMCIDKEPNNNVRGKKSPSTPSSSKEQSKNKKDEEKETAKIPSNSKEETAKIPSNSKEKKTAKIPSNSDDKKDVVAKEHVTKEKPEDEQSG